MAGWPFASASGAVLDLGGIGDQAVEEGTHERLGLRAHELRDGVAVDEGDRVRDRLQVERCDELGIGVGVHVDELEAPAVLALELLQEGSQRLARAAPGGPEVHDDRDFHGRLDHVALERRQRCIDHGISSLVDQSLTSARGSGDDSVNVVGRQHQPRRDFSYPMALVLDLPPGLKGVAELVVGEQHTAPRIGSGRIRVLATPVMINLIEAAALAAVENSLPEEHQSLGTRLDVSHIAATPVGMRVRATAEVVRVEGRTIYLKVRAEDERELIGEGNHERVVVNLARFDKRVQDKAKLAGGR
jgi:predicted thioesterase